jgi:hypothetical protein
MRVVLMCQNLIPADRIRRVAESAGVALDQIPMNQSNVPEGYDLVILDLDELGTRRLGEITLPKGSRVVGYFSHVDTALAEAATTAGVEAYPRGQFYKALPKLLDQGE